MAQVELREVSKVFPGGVMAVQRVNLVVHDREFLIVVGPSGCGKSTTLRMVAGLEEITEGEIYIGNKLVNHMPSKDRDIAMVFQNYALYPHMTVFANMAFGLKLRRYPRHEVVQRVRDAAAILGIEGLLDRRPKELSGGERQRVAVGRAIVRKPVVFLFDEPLSNLDAKLRVQMRTELSKLHTRLQATIIYVTHDQVEALTMGDRIVVMDKGFVQQVADPTTLYASPVNKFVGGFIGNPPMNFMDGRITKQDGRFYFDGGSFRVRLVETMVPRLAGYEGKPITFGIRSEDIYDKLFASEAPPENTVRVTVDVVEPMGSEVLLHLVSGSHAFVATVGANDKPAERQDLDLVFDMNKVHFFDPVTERTIV